MFGDLAKALAAGLSLWEHKEKTKYVDKLNSVTREYYKEYNKAPADRDDAELDRIEFELCLLGRAFAASVGAPQAKS